MGRAPATPDAPVPVAALDRASRERQREHFNTIADRYHRARRGENHLLLKRLMWRNFFRHVPPPRGERPLEVLEAMCGFADADALLKEHCTARLRYHGFDYSDRVIETLRAERPELDVWQA